LLDNNIQNVDTFHMHNLTAQCTRRSIQTARICLLFVTIITIIYLFIMLL